MVSDGPPSTLWDSEGRQSSRVVLLPSGELSSSFTSFQAGGAQSSPSLSHVGAAGLALQSGTLDVYLGGGSDRMDRSVVWLKRREERGFPAAGVLWLGDGIHAGVPGFPASPSIRAAGSRRGAAPGNCPPTPHAPHVLLPSQPILTARMTFIISQMTLLLTHHTTTGTLGQMHCNNLLSV